MAEVIGLASGCLALTNLAIKSATVLYETVHGFQSHSQRVHDLSDELDALNGVLTSLATMTEARSDEDFSALELPLSRCRNACDDFGKELQKCSSRSTNDRTSFRDWAKLRYMGEDIDGFRRLLSGYKMTISICLMHANLRRTSATSEDIKAFTGLLMTTRTDLEDQLDRMNEKLDLIGDTLVVSQTDANEVRTIKDERASTERCLQICTQLSEHITQLQQSAPARPVSAAGAGMPMSPEQITDEGLRECKKNLASIMRRLEQHEKDLFGRLLNKTRIATTSDEDREDLTRLRDQWEATRQSMDICSSVQDNLKAEASASTIDNYATGDAVQFMVSTNEKTIHGKNRGVGWRTRQVGGHIDPESLQQMLRSLEFMHLSPHAAQRELSEEEIVKGQETGEEHARFQSRYGAGFKLKS